MWTQSQYTKGKKQHGTRFRGKKDILTNVTKGRVQYWSSYCGTTTPTTPACSVLGYYDASNIVLEESMKAGKFRSHNTLVIFW